MPPPSIIRQAIGAMKDSTSISLAKFSKSSSSSTLEIAVVKATSHEEVPIDDRYLSQVYLLSSSSPSLAAACVHALYRRISRTSNWIVALKSLAVASHLLRHGSSMIIKELTIPRGSRHLFDLSSFRDDSAISHSWDYTIFVQSVAAYLDARLQSAVLGKLGNLGHAAAGPARVFTNMKIQSILDHIEHWQRLLERAVATRPTDAAKSDRLVQISLYLVVSETFVLYRDVSTGLTLLLDGFFRLPPAMCHRTFAACARACKQFEELESFYETCKEIGVGRRSEYPAVQKISGELLGQLEEFINNPHSSAAASPNDDRKSPPGLLSPNSVILQQKPQEQKAHRCGCRSMGGATMSDWESVLPSACNELQQQEISSSTESSNDAEEITSELKHPESSSGAHKRSASESNVIDAWEILLTASVDNTLKEASQKSLETSLSMPPERLESSANARENSHHNNPFLLDNDSASMPPLQPTFCVKEADEAAYDPGKNPFLTSLQVPSTQTEVSNGAVSQRVLQEQNLWMQQQNKLIEKSLIC